MWKRIFILILVFVILVGCGAQNDIAATPTSISLPTSTQQVLKPTLTLVATLSLENQLEIFTRLLEEDGECKLPCWWGIIPSQTTREEAVKIFESLLINTILDKSLYEISLGDGYFSLMPLLDGINIGIQYITKNETVYMIYIETEMLSNVYTKIYGNINYQEMMSEYTLETVLTKYGKPNQILIRSFSGVAGEFNPSQVLLHYPEKGIVIQYFSPNGLMIENNNFVLLTCPPKSHISLRLFNPDSNLTLEEILSLGDSFPKYKDIEEVTNMDIATFYETYQEYDEGILETSCPATLKTSENLWPSEYINP